MAKDVADLIGETYSHPLRAGFEFELLHGVSAVFISPAKEHTQSDKESEPRHFVLIRKHYLCTAIFV
jgi:hypothetical protein